MISIIVAMDEKQGIGKDGGIPWKIKGEQKRLREITTPHPIIMGRKTFESIGRILPDRLNIVVSRNRGEDQEGLVYASSLDEAIELAKNKDQDIFILGGGQIFKEAMEKDLVDRLYLTIIKGDFNCDTFFPDYSSFNKVISDEPQDNGEYKFRYLTLER